MPGNFVGGAETELTRVMGFKIQIRTGGTHLPLRCLGICRSSLAVVGGSVGA